MTQHANQVDDDLVVSLSYTLRDDEGAVIDSAGDDDPLEFIQGHGQIIAGLEEELYGMAVGAEKSVVIAPEDGYGLYDPEATDVTPIDMFPADFDLEEGMLLELHDEESGEMVEAYVSEIRDNEVVLDFNHPLAGQTLHFDVKIVDLRPATEEELDHGHVHSAHAHSHDDGSDFF
jgi:FKBP-type peptidyl-prolyl cis-trans isomerase SlyD